MENTSLLISSFVQSLETHPNGKELIAIIEDILANNSGAVSSAVISSLKRLSNNNVSLLIDFWILRGSILHEEGRDRDAVRIFFEALQWKPNDPSTWLRIADILKAKDELLKASFFLSEAQSRFESHIPIADELNSLLHQLEVRLSFSPGISPLTNEEVDGHVDPPRIIESGLDDQIASSAVSVPSARSEGSFQIPPEAENVWNLALECFEEGTKGDNLIYLNAFIHYAHSTVREVLGLDGNFKAGLDAKVAQYGLFHYLRFFNNLNSLRNAVVHDNYLLSKEEARNIHTQVTEFLSFIQTQLH
ncbi:MAG: tetratricopeptide repeat protein [Candidatus Hodarchaeota archaeon]